MASRHSSSHQFRRLQHSSESQQSEMQQTQLQPRLTYRQKRRAAQALRKGPKRGLTTGKKYVARRQVNPEVKLKINFNEELTRPVGENSDEYICDCSKWVKNYCPLNSENWSKMDPFAIKRLYDKIKGKYDLPPNLCDKDIKYALQFQCSSLYRSWRYRLKEEYFVPNSVEQSKRNRPADVEAKTWDELVDFWMRDKQKDISAKNSQNRLKQTTTSANGAKSTAKYLHEILNASATVVPQSSDTNMPSDPIEMEEEPVYLKLYERTKRHRDGRWDPDAEASYNAFMDLHASQLEKNGEDKLTVQEAYIDVLKTAPGYIRGLGPGSRPPKKIKSGGESSEIRVQLSSQIEELQQSQQASAEREAILHGVIEDLKSSNDDLRVEVQRARHEALERENKMREEALEREKKLKEEALEREKQMREDFVQLLNSLKR